MKKIFVISAVRFLIVVTLSFASTIVWAEEKRVALVIGNSAYEYVFNLPNPSNDASDIASKLEEMGFGVTLGVNLDYRQMRLMIRDFGRSAKDADIVMVYFAGHGIEMDNTNYLIPVNAELQSDRDVEFETIELKSIMNAVADSKGLKVVLVDACRNNPFLSDMMTVSATRSIGRGLARVDPGAVLVGYAARSGTLALDGDGRNSPYAQALLEHLPEPGLELGKMFRKVRDTVSKITEGYQQPFTYGSLPADDIFLIPAALPNAVHADKPNITNSPAPTKTSRQRLREAYAAAEESGTLNSWNVFLREFGHRKEERLVALAQTRRDRVVLFGQPDTPRSVSEPWLKSSYGPDGAAILTSEDRKLVQRALAYMGHRVGPADGVFGTQTLAAIATARLQNGMTQGSIVDEELLVALPDILAIDALRSEKARRYDSTKLPHGLDPKLARAIAVFELHEFVFDYFDGRLYLAVLPRGTRGFSKMKWAEALKMAQDAGGYLATVTSSAENRFLSDLFRGEERFTEYYGPANELNGPHFGLYQIPGSVEPLGGWTWVTGEPMSFQAWTSGHPMREPNNEYAQYNVQLKGRSNDTPLRNWASNSDRISTGFLVEIE